MPRISRKPSTTPSRARKASLFKLGYRPARARAPRPSACTEPAAREDRRHRRAPQAGARGGRGLRDHLAAIYYGNFSIFQSVPDGWAIDQLFPIMPIHRLKEEPTVRCVIADLTCGKATADRSRRCIDVEDPPKGYSKCTP